MKNDTIVLIAFILSLIIILSSLASSLVVSKRALKRKPIIGPFWIFAIGIFIGAVVMYYPTYFLGYFDVNDGVFEKVYKSLFLSIHNTMRLFVLDGEFDAFRDLVLNVTVADWLGIAYSLYAVVLFVLAPVMTAGVVLTFFKNATAYIVYYLSFNKEIYYFTELNLKSVILAENVYKTGGKKRLIVFLNVDLSDENNELYCRVKSIKAICFIERAQENSIRRISPSDALTRIFHQILTPETVENIDSFFPLLDRTLTEIPCYVLGCNISEEAAEVAYNGMNN